MKNFYSIGEVAKILNISTSKLRYYDKNDIISPEIRKENGYRYYSESQLWKLNNIRSLRNLGVSLNEIIDFLNTRSIKKTKEMIKFQLKKIDENFNTWKWKWRKCHIHRE